MYITCVCCGRQILPGRGVPDPFVTYSLRPKRMFANQYICDHCDDLDEDGLFPEERDLELRLHRLLGDPTPSEKDIKTANRIKQG